MLLLRSPPRHSKHLLLRTAPSRAFTPTSAQRDKKELVVWWDSACPLCTREIHWLKSMDARNVVDFVPLTPDAPVPRVEATPGGCPLTRKELLGRFHAREVGGEVVSGARAFAAVWKRMPQRQLRWVGRAAERSPLFMAVLERSYRGFLVVRPLLQWVARRV